MKDKLFYIIIQLTTVKPTSIVPVQDENIVHVYKHLLHSKIALIFQVTESLSRKYVTKCASNTIRYESKYSRTEFINTIYKAKRSHSHLD